MPSRLAPRLTECALLCPAFILIVAVTGLRERRRAWGSPLLDILTTDSGVSSGGVFHRRSCSFLKYTRSSAQWRAFAQASRSAGSEGRKRVLVFHQIVSVTRVSYGEGDFVGDAQRHCKSPTSLLYIANATVPVDPDKFVEFDVGVSLAHLTKRVGRVDLLSRGGRWAHLCTASAPYAWVSPGTDCEPALTNALCLLALLRRVNSQSNGRTADYSLLRWLFTIPRITVPLVLCYYRVSHSYCVFPRA